MLYCDPGFIEAQPKGSFAAHIRGVTKSAVPLQFPFGYLEQKPRMSREQRNALQTKMRERYAVHYTELDGLQPGVEDVVPEEERGASPEHETEAPKYPRPEAAPKADDTDAGPDL
jgi:hypothetical protein